MSFTAAYSKLRRITEEGEIGAKPPKILDWEGFKEEFPESITSMSKNNLMDNAIISEQKDATDYPEKTYKVLYGFKTWKPKHFLRPDDLENLKKFAEMHNDVEGAPLGFTFNIERFGITYLGGPGGEWEEFWKELSKYTEPFCFWHSKVEHKIPNLREIDMREEPEIFYVELKDGSIKVFEKEWELKRNELIHSSGSE